METRSEPKGLARIWWEMRKPYWAYVYHMEMAKEMGEKADEIRKPVRDFFGESNKIEKGLDSVKKFHQWSAFLGQRLTRLFLNPYPDRKTFKRYFRWYARHVGIDFEKDFHFKNGVWEFDGIKLPYPQGKVEKNDFQWELSDIVLASYFKHRFDTFDAYGDIVGNYLREYHEGPYEYGNVYIKNGDVVFDCGANIGMFSAVASRYGGNVYAFEAIPDIIENLLSKTAALNANIKIENFAVWDKEEMMNFSIVLDMISASRCDQLLDDAQLQNRKQITVPAITLDAFVERNGIERVDFIKADIEGAERNMLRGATRILRDFAPKLSLCTYHLPDDPQVMREIILAANPNYVIVEKFKKMYAYVP